MKKTLSIILSLCMLLSITAGMNLTAFAEDTLPTSGKCGDNASWKYDESTETLTISGSGKMYDYKDGSDFYALGVQLNDNGKDISKVIIESGITRIGNYAFYAMNIKSVSIPDTVTEIGDCAFFWCWNNLNNVVIPDSVKSIGVGAFNQCGNLDNISLPDGIEHIGRYAFYINGYTNNKENCENGGYYIGNYLVRVNEELTGTFKVKDGTTLIADEVFFENKPSDDNFNLILSDSVKYLGSFSTCYCKNITIPVGVKKIGTYCLDGSVVKYLGTYNQWQDISIDEYNTPEKLICSDVTKTFPSPEDKKPSSDDNSEAEENSDFEVELSKTSYVYSGKTKKPSVTVTYKDGTELKENEDYTVTYDKGRKYVGKYAVTVDFIGDYSGSESITAYFTIKPKGTTLKKLYRLKKGFKANWKKQRTQTSGYQLQYSRYKSFKKSKKVTVKGNKKTLRAVKKLSKKKYYYVRIRTYKTVNGEKIYSSWSKAKKVKTR